MGRTTVAAAAGATDWARMAVGITTTAVAELEEVAQEEVGGEAGAATGAGVAMGAGEAAGAAGAAVGAAFHWTAAVRSALHSQSAMGAGGKAGMVSDG